MAAETTAESPGRPGRPAGEGLPAWLCPQVAVLTSDDAEGLASRAGLTLTDLLLPYSQLPFLCQLKDPANPAHPLTIQHLSVEFRDLRRDGFLCSDELLHSVLSQRLAPTAEERGSWETGEEAEGEDASLELFRSGLLRWAGPVEGEFLRHYLACLLVVSTAHPDPLDQLQRLSQAQHALQHSPTSDFPRPAFAQQPSWFVPNIFKFHLLLHDSAYADEAKAQGLLETMKMSYGAHAVHLLRLNSAAAQPPSPPLPDPWHKPLQRKYRGLAAGLEACRAVQGAVAAPSPSPGPPLGPIAQPPPSAAQSPAQPPPIVTVGGDIRIDLNGDEPAKEMTESTDLSPNEAPKALEAEQIPHALSTADLTSAASTEVLTGAPPSTELPGSFVFPGPRIGAGQPSLGPLGASLSAEDREGLATFVQEFVQKGLLGFVERQMRVLHEQVSSRSRFGKGLLSVTKGWLGRSPAAGSSASLSPSGPASPAHHSYTPESPEMQARRLADLAFLFHHYQLAFGLYQSLKKDFQADGAWAAYAGALEMAGLSAYLLGPEAAGRPFPSHYLDSAMATWGQTLGRPLAAGRAALLSAEALLALGRPAEAAAQLIRLTNARWDLWSAAFLRAAARAFHQAAFPRKAALHFVLAGHRFSKALQPFHALQAYHTASLQYNGRGWTLAEDHIWYTIGQTARQLGLGELASEALARLLHQRSKQTAAQQALFLREFLAARAGLPPGDLPVPLPQAQATVSHFGGWVAEWDWETSFQSASGVPKEEAEERWGRLESACLNSFGDPGLTPAFPASLHFPHGHPGSSPANGRLQTIQADEVWVVDVHLHNPLAVPLGFRTAALELQDPAMVQQGQVVLQTVENFVVKPLEEAVLRLGLTPTSAAVGSRLAVSGVSVALCPVVLSEDAEEPNQNSWTLDDTAAVEGRLPLSVRGPRLSATKEHRGGVFHGSDLRLEAQVVAPAFPVLSARLSAPNLPGPSDGPLALQCLAGELIHLQLGIHHTAGSSPTAGRVSKMALAASPPSSVAVLGSGGAQCPVRSVHDAFPVRQEETPQLHTVHALPSELPSQLSLTLWAPEEPGEKWVQLVLVFAVEGLKGHRRIRRWLRLDTSALCQASAKFSAQGLATLCLRNVSGQEGPGRLSLRRLSSLPHHPLQLHRLLTSSASVVLEPGEVENVCLGLGGGEGRVVGEEAEGFPAASVLSPRGSGGDAALLCVEWRAESGGRSAAGLSLVKVPPMGTSAPSGPLPPVSLRPPKAVREPPSVSVDVSVASGSLVHDFSQEGVARVAVEVALGLAGSGPGEAEVEWSLEGSSAGVLWAGGSRGTLVLSRSSPSAQLRLTALLSGPGLYQLSAPLTLRSRWKGAATWLSPSKSPAFLTITNP